MKSYRKKNNRSFFKNHRFFNIHSANFNQVNRYVPCLPSIERIKLLLPSTIINFQISYIAVLIRKILLKENSENTRADIYIALLVAMVVTVGLYINELSQSKNRTKYLNQNRVPSDHQIWQALLSIEAEYPDIINKWMLMMKIEKLSHVIPNMKKELNKGMCQGYTLSAIDQLSQSPYLTGRQLIDHLDFDVIIKKSILQLIRDDFPSNLNYKEINYLTQTLFHIRKPTYLNNSFPYTDIQSLSVDKLINIFMLSIKNEFISINQYNIDDNLNRITISDDKIMNKNEKNHINKIIESESNLQGKATRFFFSNMKIQDYKNKIKLYTRKKLFIKKNTQTMPKNTVLAGDIFVRDFKNNIAHSMMFRCSNGLYYFLDSNYGANEYITIEDFFCGLKKHLINYYYSKNSALFIKFIFHALYAENSHHIKVKKL